MNNSIEELLANGPVITDGAWGTQLQARGLPPGESPERWNLEQPDQVAAIAAAYAEAGSQVIITNTFGGNRARLAEYSLADRLAEINRQGVVISRQGVAGKARVFASIGPTGKLLANEETTEQNLLEIFAEQVQALAQASPDAILIETMADLAEARLAVRAAKASGLPVVACMVFDSGKQKDRTLMGNTPEQAANGLAEAGADVIGANCGQGIAGFLPICQRLRAASKLPIWIKANAGLPEMVDGKPVYRTTPAEFASHARPLVEAGACFIGGCCGTSPEFIRALAAVLA